MKNILLLLIFYFVFAKNGVAAIPSCSILSSISMSKNSTIRLSESAYQPQPKAKKEISRSLKTINIIANIGLFVLALSVASFLAFFVGYGFVLAGILILLGSLITVYLMIKMRKTNKMLRKHPLLEADPIIAEQLYLTSAKLGILCAFFTILFLSTILLTATEGIFFSLVNPIILIASITAIMASIFSAVFFKINKKVK